LIQCHEDHKIGKWFGACNDAKYEMDKCFREEKEQKRKANMEKARAFDQKFEEFMKKKELNEK
jgi:COX assembly protein 2